MTEEHGKNKGTQTDLDSLELEIDKEIDALFVPAAKSKEPEAEIAPGDGTEAAPVEAAASGQIGGQAGSDLDTLQLEIDREIDSLFVPGGKGKEIDKSIGDLKIEEEDILPPVAQTADDNIGVLKIEIELPPVAPAPAPSPVQETQAVSAPPPEDEPLVSAPTGFRTKYPSRAELPTLIEEFNAAYLSLDWEFSADNIRRLESALNNLESFSSSSQGSASISKILKALLARLAAKPQAVNSWIMELVRDSQGLLAHLLLTEGPPGQNEKERINALIGRFRQMREKVVATRDKTAEKAPETLRAAETDEAEQASGPLPPEDEDSLSYPTIEIAGSAKSISGKMPDRWSLLELRNWIESSRDSLIEAVEGAESELLRLSLVESALGKTEALSPVVTRLADIRGGLEGRLESLRGQGEQWSQRIEWVENLARFSSAYDASSEELPEADAEIEVEEPVGQVASTVPEQTRVEEAGDLMLFRYSGRLYGIPSENVAKSQKVSAKKAQEILKRGHGSLADVKQLFRSVRKGVSGRLSGMSAKELQSIRFNIIGPKAFDIDEIPPDSRMLIFISDGKTHGLILADTDQVVFQPAAELTYESCSCRAAVGTVRTGSGICAEVLDLDRVFQCSQS